MKKMIGDELPNLYQQRDSSSSRSGLLVNIVFWFPPFQISQGFRQMIIQGHSFMPKLADEQIFVFGFFLERQSSFELVSC